MRFLQITILVLTILTGQWAILDHSDHDHTTGEVCDFCIGTKSLEHTTTSTFSFNASATLDYFEVVSTTQHFANKSFAHYSVRAPPRFI